MFQEKLNELRPYVTGIRFVKDLPVVDVVLHDGWDMFESETVIYKHSNNNQNYFMVHPKNPKDSLDIVLSHVEYVIDFNVEKESVHVDEFIRINIPSSTGGRALISLETGSEVLQTFWVETKAENTVVEFEATSAMSPNVYAHITMLQPHAQTLNDLPIRMYGVQAIEVTDPGTQLAPIISMPDELRSEQEFKVMVSEENEKPMTYTIAIVEDGLLDLTKYKTPEPWNTISPRLLSTRGMTWETSRCRTVSSEPQGRNIPDL